jgi:exonuclease VII small subunit
LTAANVTIQDASKSSTGLRTIAARIRNTKTELDALGETENFAKYDKLVQALTRYNVALTDVTGQYRSTFDILQDIAKIWDKLDTMEQAALATQLAGTRQQAVFYSIIEQFKDAEETLDSAKSQLEDGMKQAEEGKEQITQGKEELDKVMENLWAETAFGQEIFFA